MDKTAQSFDGVLILNGQARSAFASFGYALIRDEINLEGLLPPNHIEALKQAYNDAFWNGRY